MGTLEFICDIRFHHSIILPPNPETGRSKPYRVSYADYGDHDSNAVVLFCGALMGTRFCYSPLDQLARAYNVRIIHPDRPGVGGSDPVELHQRISMWLELVPSLLSSLDISHVSLVSHSGGDIYLLNTILTYPHLLHPISPYICFFAPWVHPSHSKITHLRVAELLPAPLIGHFASVARFVNHNVVPLVGLSSGYLDGIKDSFHYHSTTTTSSPVPLVPAISSTRISNASRDGLVALALDDPDVVNELRGLIATYHFAESIDGISADAQLFLKKPHSTPWCSPDIAWSDIDSAVLILSEIINQQKSGCEDSKTWAIDAFHAENDGMVGMKGRLWFDECWMPTRTSIATTRPSMDEEESEKIYDYKSTVVAGSEHDFLMDPRHGASEVWLQRVRASFPFPEEV